MNYFEETTLRLKQVFKVNEDQEVAELLGLSKRAWAGRKQRGSFPEKELYAYAGMHPELNLDVRYILHGSMLKVDINTHEMELIYKFRHCSDLVKNQTIELIENDFRNSDEYKQVHNLPITKDEPLILDLNDID